jgi:hypothetical protein
MRPDRGSLGPSGCEARWAGVVSVWAGRQAKAQGGGGQWAGPICGKKEKLIPNLIFGLTRILKINSRSFWVKKDWEKFQKFFKILLDF